MLIADFGMVVARRRRPPTVVPECGMSVSGRAGSIWRRVDLEIFRILCFLRPSIRGATAFLRLSSIVPERDSIRLSSGDPIVQASLVTSWLIGLLSCEIL